MPKIDLDGWKKDKALREDRILKGFCPMCGSPKRPLDEYDSDDCKTANDSGLPSQEKRL